MGKFIDLTGKRFGHLTVIKRDMDWIAGGKACVTWLCKCDCGKETVVFGSNLRSGSTTSCGCVAKPHKARAPKHEITPHYNPPAPIRVDVVIGNIYHVDGHRVECVGVYDNYARFKHLDANREWFESWSYWDLQRRMK